MTAPPRKLSGPPPRKQTPLAQWIYFGEHPNNRSTLFASCSNCGVTIILASGAVALTMTMERKKEILTQFGYMISGMELFCKSCARRKVELEHEQNRKFLEP